MERENYVQSTNIVDTYDEIYAKNASSNACYDEAYAAVRYQGGVEIWNSNNELTSGISSTPNRIFKFDDGSYVNVTCGGPRILTEEDLIDEKSGIFSYIKGSNFASFFVFQFG
ncbi:hypothetical protein HG442_000885 [Candidatus Gracilibacteria bacterium]|nr:hypothetical protein [Candidatus Gracilibacteria bacterium]